MIFIIANKFNESYYKMFIDELDNLTVEDLEQQAANQAGEEMGFFGLKKESLSDISHTKRLIKDKVDKILKEYKFNKIFFNKSIFCEHNFYIKELEIIYILKNNNNFYKVGFKNKLSNGVIKKEETYLSNFTNESYDKILSALFKLTADDLEQQVANQEGENMGFFDLKIKE